MQTRTESVAVDDGAFDMHLWVPERGRGPGLLLIQEIYGVGKYIRGVAEKLAARGYVVGAPDLFWRLQPGWAAEHDEEGLQQSLKLASRFQLEAGVADLSAAFDRLRELPEVTGAAGVLGFCLGGTMAYHLAARRSELAAAVSFYGSGVPSALELAGRITCPLQFHFGGSDPYIPREQIAAVEEAVAPMPNVEIHVQEEAGHAFHNWEAPMFHQPEHAERAWSLTERFLERHLPC
ncbi:MULTISPECIES: dienelactone hydrolase family protein [Thermomonospora]|uniref:Carboxymethylenebutenolidase n=1 Tax=Thermomonospora curvata (strain ATCC 19995 / DSM 43183 / JCM 3096 / KCTC 9072 / NBRC 15933 / NCIMB 10081 / Henssen B9) TaxID=471852 RepID=D1A3E0_THECD|nr:MULTISPECIES: dienelactone hydrolase family protein [Thermomonospora]ACY96065.1 Carboxymethylenebutenolidase [Thermomonospora curvata DSM 43183]PKK15928.1 MAG: dienelactone hydrolase family protein [Thermomonospora sp. CIF 1]